MDPTPPVDIADFPGEFVGAMINTFRTSFLGPQHLMTVSMPEPSPLPMGIAQKRNATTLRLMVEIQAAAGTNASHGSLDLFRRLLFKIQPILRAKTYYSTQPFSMMPSQTMATLRGPVRFHDSMLKLSAFDFSSSSWQPKFFDDVPRYEEYVGTTSTASESSQSSSARRFSESSARLSKERPLITAWTTSISVPIEPAVALLPTFCSAIASRQYSLIARVNVSGASIKEFILEAPVQVYYSPCGSSAITTEQNQQRPESEGSVLTHQQGFLSDELVRDPSNRRD